MSFAVLLLCAVFFLAASHSQAVSSLDSPREKSSFSICNVGLTQALVPTLLEPSAALHQWLQSHFGPHAAQLIPAFERVVQNGGIPFSSLVRLEQFARANEGQNTSELVALISQKLNGNWAPLLHSPRLLEIFIQTAILSQYQPSVLNLRENFLDTQEQISNQAWVRAVFGFFPTLQMSSSRHVISVPSLARDASRILIVVGGTDHLDATHAGRVHTNTSIADLAPGTYTYLFLANGTQMIGLVKDAWEFGVKHQQLAGQSAAHIGGTLKVHANGEIEYNARSGSTSRVFDLQHGHSREEMRARAEAVFRLQLVNRADRRLTFTPETLLPREAPSTRELEFICAHLAFRTNNPQICR